MPPEDLTATQLPLPAVSVPGFKVLGSLGAGAMGEVYLAEDSKLRRRVAIKLVSPTLCAEEEVLRRFLREAQAMASIEDPHVVRIYGFGEDDGVPYIVMELVEGESLRDRLSRHGKLPLADALTITLQIALGLEAAAAKGIVHRDIKPSNILLDRAGQVRVADFGLARPVVTEDSALTGTGSFVGTPHYVSPEQARGEAVDFRSDMYSLGILLYELLTGDKPFKGSTPVMVVASHLHESLPSLRAARPELPGGVVELVEQMTRKDPADRPASYEVLRARIDALIAELAYAQPRRLGSAARLAAWVAVVGALGLSTALGYRMIRGSGKKATSPLQIDKLTDRGTASDAVLSRDGRYLAYLSDGLWVKDLREKTETRVTLPGEGGPARLNGISSDGSYVFYSDSAFRPFKVPIIGGTPQLVAEWPFLVSPDAKRLLAYSKTGVSLSNADGTGRSQVSSGEASSVAWTADSKRALILKAGAIYEIDLAGGREEKRADLSGLSTDDAQMSLRPGGEIIAMGLKKPGDSAAFLYAFDLRRGTRQPLGESAWSRIDSVTWLPDGDMLIVGGSEPGKLRQIWMVSYPDGARKALPGEYDLKGVTADGSGIVAEQSTYRSELRVSSADSPSAFKRLAVGTAPFSLCWTPGGEIIYSSIEAGTFDLYVLSPESNARHQLTFDRSGAEVDPAASPDGRYVVFTAGREGETGVWRVNKDGTGLVKLVAMPGRQQLWNQPQVSSDSKWVLYSEDSGAEGGPTLKRVSIDGGTPLVIKGSREGDPRPWEFAFSGGWSRGGREVAFLYFTNRADGGQTPVELAVSSLEGAITRRFPYTPNQLDQRTWEHQLVQWSAEGPDRYLYFLRDGQVWKQAVAGGAPTQVTHFEEEVFDFDWSSDGKRLACSLAMTQSDIVLITGFR